MSLWAPLSPALVRVRTWWGGRSRTGFNATPGNGARGWHGNKARNSAQPLPGKTSGGAAGTASVSL